MIAAYIEKSIEKGEISGTYAVKIPKSLAGINRELPPKLHSYITGNHKKIVVGGQVFITVEYSKKI